jgi:putative ABC transport system permease protein
VSTVGVVTAVALGVAVVATFVSAVRAARTSTVHALADSARRPRRTRWLIALSRRRPVPLLLGLRVIARRPRRVLLGVASIAVTAKGIVAVLAGRRDGRRSGRASQSRPADRPPGQVLLVITVMLVALAAINATVITGQAASRRHPGPHGRPAKRGRSGDDARRVSPGQQRTQAGVSAGT